MRSTVEIFIKRPREQTPKEIGKRIHRAREARGALQADLAVACGVSRTAVSQWENGDTHASDHHLELAAAWLDVPIEWLRRAEGKPPVPTKLPDFKDKRRATNGRFPREAQLGWSRDVDEPPFEGAIAEMENGIGSGAPHKVFVEQRKQVRDWWRIPPRFLRAQNLDAMDLRILRVDLTHPETNTQRGSFVLINTAQRLPVDGRVFVIENGVGYILQRLRVLPTNTKEVGLIGRDECSFVPRTKVKIVGEVVAVYRSFE